MALILAIEPDRRQAKHLTAMVRGRLRAELVLGDTAERALAALGDRVPDLVLTTTLLSPRDEAELTDRLRALDGAAAHLQTLTIPVLALPSAKKSSKSGGMLSGLLRDRGDDDPADGCDPAFFAEQCKEYLQRAASEKAASLEAKDDDREPIVITPAVIEPVAAVEPVELERRAAITEFANAATVQPVEPLEPVVATIEPAAAGPATRSIRDFYTHTDDEQAPSSLMAAVAAFAEEEPAVEQAETDSDAGADFDLSSMLEDPVHATQASTELINEAEAGVEVYELDSSLVADSQDEPSAIVSEVQLSTPLYTPLAQPEVRTWPILEGLATGANGDHPNVAEASEPTVLERREPDEHRLVEWSDILEALRRDAQPVALEREQPAAVQAESIQLPNVLVDAPFWPEAAAPQTAAPEPVAPEPVAHEPTLEEPAAVEPLPEESGHGRRKRSRKASVEDEWGFFDPDRAGFAALLAKLEEITEDDSAKTQRT
jgi:hypothetical protein